VANKDPLGELTPSQQKRAVTLEARLFGYHDIANQIGATFSQVKGYFSSLQRETLSALKVDKQVEIIRHLTCLEQVRSEAWLAWERSQKKTRRVTEVESNCDGKITTTKNKSAESEYGDPRFLEIIAKVLKQSAELLALTDTDKRPSELIAAARKIGNERDRLRRIGYDGID
jgi:hypothetical protein